MERLPGMIDVYRIAAALHKDVDEILAMPSKRLTYWMAYFNIKEAGHKRLDAEIQIMNQVRGGRR